MTKVAVVGCGLIGGSVALAVRRVWPDCRIVGIDRGPVIDAALGRGAIDAGGDDLSLVDGAEIVLLAAPVRQNVAILAELPSRIRGEALVTDVGSTKQAIVDAARTLPARLQFVGGHPLAGAATGGFESARADLFRQRPWILTPEPDRQDSEAVRRAHAFVTAIGARAEVMDPASHDRLMAYLSHLPQLAVSALMHVVGEHAGADNLRLAGTGLRDTTRLASSPAGTWKDVTATNAVAVAAAIDDLTVALQQLKADLADGRDLQRVFDRAAAWKQVLDASAVTGRDES